MTKMELVSTVSEASGLSKSDVDKVLECFLKTLAETMKARQEVRLVGFGVFYAREKKEGTARNPKTGETVMVPACLVPAFKPGKLLKEAVNG